jgi:hypothetical protein
MTEQRVNALQSLHGLQDYFEFASEIDHKRYIDFLLKLLYAEQPVIRENEPFSLEEFVHTLRQYAPSHMLSLFYKYYRQGYPGDALQDAFSRGQVQSKIWLVRELAKINEHFPVIYHLGGWYGQLTWFLKDHLSFDKYRNFDADPRACEISDTIFNLHLIEGYQAKSVEMQLPTHSDPDDVKNMTWISRTGCEYTLKSYSRQTEIKEKTQPDLIINTSAEHMSSIWYDKFVNRPQETDPLFVIQSNNLFDAEGHANCVHSIEHFLKKFKMTRVEYTGELQLQGYKRFMIIGRP